jgi:hypothetical protein
MRFECQVMGFKVRDLVQLCHLCTNTTHFRKQAEAALVSGYSLLSIVLQRRRVPDHLVHIGVKRVFLILN